MKPPSRLMRKYLNRLVGAFLLFAIVPAIAGVSCLDDRDMIDRHEQKLDEEDE